jgi:pimeloyl-ACP methyl ester carboxylesterase
LPYVEVGSRRVYYASHGQPEGTPVVLIHGAGGNRLLWGSQIRSLSLSHHVAAVDLPGHGRSDGPGMATIAELAEVAAEVVGCLGSRAVVVGHSMGGGVAMQLALERPNLVAGLVLVATGSRLRVAPSLLASLRSDFALAAESIAGLAFAPETASKIRKRGERALLAAGPDTLPADFRACDAFDVQARLASISAPCLVICGAKDRMTPLKYSEYLSRAICGAHLQVVESAGHMVMLEKPAAVSHAILAFLASL